MDGFVAAEQALMKRDSSFLYQKATNASKIRG
jgi:hypothetical protein